eukprot:GSChrysophyteH1.ASY1.ANO1.2806.1 assembled CDS
MGNAASRPPQSAANTRAHFNTDLPTIGLVTKMGKHGMIGDGKFMKSYCMRADGHTMVVKVYMRLNDENLSINQEQLHQLWLQLSPTEYPNLLPYQMWIRSTSPRGKNQPQPIYLIRQYLAQNMYDRCLSRPFLTECEKLWLIYQIFEALEICHDKGIVHGDLKPENVLSSNWHFVVLTDFAPYKPTYIPDDDPTEFQYFFDSSARRSCYVAPERFVPRNTIETGAGGIDRNAPLKPSMDVFSLGCVIAEVFLDCKTPLLDLPAMLQYIYGAGESTPTILGRIKDPRVRNLICHMTHRDPEKRLSVTEYKQVLEGPVFPKYFREAMGPLYKGLHRDGVTPDRRVSMICRVYAELLKSMIAQENRTTSDEDEYVHLRITNVDEAMQVDDSVDDERRFKVQQEYMAAARSRKPKRINQDNNKKSYSKVMLENPVSGDAASPVFSGMAKATKSKEKVDELDELTERCKKFLKDVEEFCNSTNDAPTPAVETKMQDLLEESNTLHTNGLVGSVEQGFDFFKVPDKKDRLPSEGMVIIVTLIGSVFRHVRFPQSKVCLILLLVRLAPVIDFEVILQRVVPILVGCMDDENHSHIRALALRALTAVLMQVQALSSAEANIFPSYLIPTLNRLVKDEEIIVRVAFAECLGKLAETAKRFLEYSHLIALNASLSSNAGAASASPSTSAAAAAAATSLSYAAPADFPYTRSLRDLHENVTQWVKTLCDESQGEMRRGSGLSNNSSLVKRTLLRHIMRICVFFGVDACVSQILPYLLTFFSDQDWELRYAFWDKISSVCAFIGPTLTEAYILPGLENAVVDLLSIPVIMRYVVSKASVILLHPCYPVREAAIGFIAAASQYIGAVDTAVFLLPVLAPYFKQTTDRLKCLVLTPGILSSLIVEPVDRLHYRRALLQRQKYFLDNSSSATAELVIPYNSAIIGTGTEEEEVDEESQMKLKLLEGYIDQSAKELTSKTMQWRHALGGGINGGAFTASLRRSMSLKQSTSPGSLDALLNITGAHSLSQNLQTLMIPHQKFGQGFFYNLTEEQRCLASEISKMRNPASICALFGIFSSKHDAVRGLNQGGTNNLHTTHNSKVNWKPRENCLVCNFLEHTQSINRLAVSPDQSFFGSASSDGTVKIWQLSGLDRTSLPRSSLTYRKHRAPVLDLCSIENSHSMASADAHGSIHVWRIDLESRLDQNFSSNNNKAPMQSSLNVTGLNLTKTIDTNEGLIAGLQHFNSESASVLTYVTQCGGLHGWDLRSSQEVFYFKIGPELGIATAMAISPDRASWVIVGTSKGFIALWDLRYNIMCRLWQHSSAGPICKLACSKSISGSNSASVFSAAGSPAIADTEGSYLFCAAAIVGRTPIHLITAGSDKTIRYWDFKSPAKCYVVSGLEAGQPKAAFEAPTGSGINGRLFVCYDSALPSLEATLSSHLPLRGDRGPMVPSPGSRSPILDIKSVELPVKGLLSGSKDGVVKLWR